MAARKTKKTTRSKAAKTTPKKKAKTASSAAAKKPSAAKASSASEGSPAAKPTSAAGAVSSRAVNMGNVFALRPRVTTSFRQENFLEARRLLEDESYASLEEAARAVAERALELCNDPGRRGRNH